MNLEDVTLSAISRSQKGQIHDSVYIENPEQANLETGSGMGLPETMEEGG